MNARVPELERLYVAGDGPGFDPAEAKKRATQLLGSILKERTALPYPAHALGPLADACKAIAEAGQVQPAMVGQTLLGAASLLTQGLFNVETLSAPKPLSLNLKTDADSGDGKTTATDVALRPVTDWQRQAAKEYAFDLSEYEREKATRKRNEDPPLPPKSPFRIVTDATVEGLRRDFETGPTSQGVFSDEAAATLSGYGMSADHRTKTAAVFSKLFDSGHLSVSRSGSGRVERYGRRLAVHWLIQPMAGVESATDPMLTALGFWPRFLAAYPAPQAPRLARPFRPQTLPAVGRYWSGCAELLARPLADDATDCPLITLEDAARRALSKAFERFEVEARLGSMRVIKPFALRAAEQACRVAGVLSAFDGKEVISAETLCGALELVGYSLDTWASILDGGAADQSGAHALRLYDWLLKRPGWSASLAEIVHGGPGTARTKDKRDASLALLGDFGLVEVVAGKAFALMPPAAITGSTA